MKNIKNHLRKYLSVERRDLWNSPRIYEFKHLSVDTLKHKQRHISKKDIKMKNALQEALQWKMRTKKKPTYRVVKTKRKVTVTRRPIKNGNENGTIRTWEISYRDAYERAFNKKGKNKVLKVKEEKRK